VYQRRDRPGRHQGHRLAHLNPRRRDDGKGPVVGVLGAALGLVLTYPGVAVVNEVAEAIAGFEGSYSSRPKSWSAAWSSAS